MVTICNTKLRALPNRQTICALLQSINNSLNVLQALSIEYHHLVKRYNSLVSQYNTAARQGDVQQCIDIQMELNAANARIQKLQEGMKEYDIVKNVLQNVNRNMDVLTNFVTVDNTIPVHNVNENVGFFQNIRNKLQI